MTIMTTQLPEQFNDLQTLAERWALPTFAARYDRRATAEMAELQQFYDTLLPQMPQIMEFLHQYETGKELPAPVDTLMQLAMSFMDVAPAVELFFQPMVPYAKDYREAQLQVYC